MKSLYFLFSFLVLMGCDLTAIDRSLCQNNLSDIRGFAGRYNWDLGEGQKIPVSVRRLSRGKYALVSSDGAEAMTYQTCRFGRLNIAESLVEGEAGDDDFLAAFKISLSSRSTVISTLQFDEKVLSDNAIKYELEETEIEGIPLSMILIDNSQLAARDLINLSVESNGKEPFYIELTK